MPLVYVIDPDQQCIFMHASGVIDDWELGTKVQKLWDEDLFNPEYARVIDAWSVAEWRADTRLLRAIATDVRAKHPRQVAMLARSEPVLAEFQIYVDSLGDIPGRVFESLGQAISWVGVRVPDHWPPSIDDQTGAVR